MTTFNPQFPHTVSSAHVSEARAAGATRLTGELQVHIETAYYTTTAMKKVTS